MANENDNGPFCAEALSSILKEKHISLTRLAAQTAISIGYLSELRRGLKTNPTIDILCRISATLDRPLQDFLVTNNENTPPNQDLHPLAARINQLLSDTNFATDKKRYLRRTITDLVDFLEEV